MTFYELFEKYKDIDPNQIQSIIGGLTFEQKVKDKLIHFIESHQNIESNGDSFEKSIAFVATQTINNLNEEEWVGKTIGKYKIERVINSGATGAVFLGQREDDFNQTVAVKLINPSVTEMIGEENVLNEANLMASLNHVGIAKIFDSGRTDDGIIYFIIEYIEGQSLSDLIAKRIDVNQSIRIAIKICSAISHAHENQILHKDLKPDNILIDKDGEVKIIDFGLSQNNKNNSQSTIDFVAYSKSYASPEHLSQETLTSKTDIFSIGCVLFEMITGDRYFTDKDTGADNLNHRSHQGTLKKYISRDNVRKKFFSSKSFLSALAVMSNNPVKIKLSSSLFVAELSSMIEKTLKDDPQLRYKTCDALSHDLERLTLDHPVSSYNPRILPLYHGIKFSKRNPIIIAMALIICCSFVGFSLETKRRLNNLVDQQSNVNQVLGRFSELLIHADPRERLGNPISFVDVLITELNTIISSEQNNMTDSVKYELLMTIGEGLLGHGEGKEAEIAYKNALKIAKNEFGDKSIEVVTVTVKLIQTYTQNVYFDETIALVEPFIDKVFVLDFEHIEYAKMFIEINKVNSRLFFDRYSSIRKELPIVTLQRISKRFGKSLTPLELIDLDLSIIKGVFYGYFGDFASPTAHISESQVQLRVKSLVKLIPSIEKLIMISGKNANASFLMPELLSWKARLNYEAKYLDNFENDFQKSLTLAMKYFEKNDYRLAGTYLKGAAMFRFIDTGKSLFYATKALEIDFNALNNDPVEYLDNMTMYFDFLYVHGEFDQASKELKKALGIISALQPDEITLENQTSIIYLFESYESYAHRYQHAVSEVDFIALKRQYSLCAKAERRRKLQCKLDSYIFNTKNLDTEELLIHLNEIFSIPFDGEAQDNEIFHLTILNLQNLNMSEIAVDLLPLYKENINWGDFEKSNSMEYFSKLLLIGDIYKETGDIEKAKKEYLDAELILDKHYRDDSAFVAILYTGLAEVAFSQNEFDKSQGYLDKTSLSFTTHFDSSSPLTKRKEKLTRALSKTF